MHRWEDNIKVGVRDGVGGLWDEFTWLMLDTSGRLFGRLLQYIGSIRCGGTFGLADKLFATPR